MKFPQVPLPVLVVISAGIYAAYFFSAIVIFNLPSYRFPYWFSILSAIALNALAIKFWLDGAEGPAYGLAILNVFIGSAQLLIVVSHMVGPGTALYGFMNSRPFAR